MAETHRSCIRLVLLFVATIDGGTAARTHSRNQSMVQIGDGQLALTTNKSEAWLRSLRQAQKQTHRFGQVMQTLVSSKGPEIVSNGQSEDATKNDFMMPPFNDLARVRSANLALHFRQETSVNPAQIVAKWGEGSRAARGIGKDVWDTEFFGIRIPAFDHWCKAVGTIDYMTLDDFIKFQDRNPDFNPETPGGLIPGVDESDDTKIKEWLQKNFRYGGSKALDLAEAYTTMPAEGEGWKKTIDLLAAFATLDTSHDNKLNYAEVHACLSKETSPVEQRIEWADVARVEDVDIAKLKFPTDFTRDILAKIAPEEKQGKISSADWASNDLTVVLTDFVKRDKSPEDAAGGDWAKETFSGNLKFFQIADLFPGNCDANRHITLNFGGTETPVFAPDLDELSGKKKLMSAKPEDVLHWLKTQGYKDGGRWFTSSDKYATNMARQIVKWGCGMIPGVSRPGEPNFRLAGPKGYEDQYTDVACRLAGFVKFDSGRHGKLQFDEALPILYAAHHG